MYEELILGFLFILILSDSLDDSLSFAKNLKNIYIVILAVFFFFDTDNFQPLNKLYKIFFPFFIFAFCITLLSVNESFFYTSLQKTISFILLFMILPNFFTKLYRENGEVFLRRFVFFVITFLLIGFLLKYSNSDFVYLENGRYRGVLGSPNGLGLYGVLAFVFFYVLNDFFPALFGRYEKYAMYVIILISIYWSGSRNSVIAVLIFYLFQRFYVISPFFGLIMFFVALFLTEMITTNLTSIILWANLGDFFRINTLEEGSGRYIAWNFAWHQIQYNFFVGKGFAYNEYFMRQNYSFLSKLGHQGGIHNSFLTFWMDQGLIGLVIYLRSFILMFIKAAQKTRFAFPAMFAISFTAYFESWLVASLSAFAFLAMFIYTVLTSEEILPKNTGEIDPDDQPEFAKINECK